MPNKTLAVKTGAGADATINTLPDVGQATKANSLPVALASDDGSLVLLEAIRVLLAATPVLPTGAATATAQAAANTLLTAIAQALAGTLAVSASALPLPNGASTSANQSAGNTVLGNILSALAGTLNIQGAVTVSDGAGPLTIDAATLPLPTGASTSALQTAGNTSLTSIASALAGALTVQGAVTVSDGAGPLSVDGTVNVGNLPATQAVSATALPLPTGAATAAKQDSIVSAVIATGPGTNAFAVTPSDTLNFTTSARSLYVGAAGDVVVVTPAGTAVTFKSVPAGSVLPVLAQRVNATATTASNIVGLV